MISDGNLRPRAFARISTCFGERSVSTRTSSRASPSLMQLHRGAGLVMPAAHGAAGRKRVARHDVAVLERALGLIAQRRAEVLDRVDEVQAGGEQLQVVWPPRAPARRTERDRAAARCAPGRSAGPDRTGNARPAPGAASSRAPPRRPRGRA